MLASTQTVQTSANAGQSTHLLVISWYHSSINEWHHFAITYYTL